VRRTLPALLAALVARATPAAPAVPAPPRIAGDVQVAADKVTFVPSTGRVLLEGNARVRRGAVVLRARSAEWDPATGEVRAAGGVLLTDASRVVSADAIRVVLGGSFEAEGVLAFVKDQPVDLAGVATAAEAGRTGTNRLSFQAPRLNGSADGRMRLVDARLTLCDCPGDAPPAWEITSSDADVVPGERAILTWPVLRVAPPFVDRTYPVFVFPWLYVPLGDRQSGLLVPLVGSTGASGFSLAQPIFLTLGRSADATLTPEYAFGRAGSDVAAGKPAVRGPGLRLELRWAPAERSEGRAELAWIHDLDAEPGGEHGSRGALVLTHGQRIGEATSLQAGLHLAGDPVWVRDTTPDVLGRAVPYRRSDVLVSHRRGAAVAEAVASYVQPLDPVAVSTLAPWGTLGADRGVSSRFAAASATVVPEAVGPVRLSGRIGAARFGPVEREARDVAGRPSSTRADARAEVAVPLLLGRAASLAAFVRGAALAYAPEGADVTGTAWGVGGATLETEVSRRFGERRHAIAPRLEWRAGTQAAGDPLRVPAYDHLDRSTAGLLSATPGQFQQLRAAVETRLETARATLLRAELGQDADLRAGRLGEAFASVAVAAGSVSADAGLRFFPTGRENPAPPPRISSPLDALSELRVAVAAQDARGDSVRAAYFSVGPGGSGRLVAGLDPLFDDRPAPLEAAASATLAARAAVGGGVKLGYEALFPGRASYVPTCEGSGERRVNALQVQQHAATVLWDSPCRCFRLTAVVRVTDCGDVSYSATVDLGRLGGNLGR
jgi:LPS-assembly protein